MAAAMSTCRLPGGYFDEQGRLHDEAELVPLAGRDEEVLLDEQRLPAAAVTALLSRTLVRVGTLTDIDESLARRLLVADRQALLLRLRELTFGPRVKGNVLCPLPGCGQRVSLDFAIADLPVRALADKRPAYECELPEPAGTAAGDPVRTVLLRLPNGGDQEALCAAVAAGGSAVQALRLLVQRCLVGGSPSVDELAPADLLAIERFLADTAPAVDLEVCARCPHCRRELTTELDIQDFFFGELATSAEQLYQDVHLLALHYHWSEQEILALSRTKRERYLGILADALEGQDDRA
jgi:hypothetical protein